LDTIRDEEFISNTVRKGQQGLNSLIFARVIFSMSENIWGFVAEME
jgi:hypothetical protein